MNKEDLRQLLHHKHPSFETEINTRMDSLPAYVDNPEDILNEFRRKDSPFKDDGRMGRGQGPVFK